MKYLRLDSDLPMATSDWGWRFHHLGIPTEEHFEEEKYLPHLKFYVSGFSSSPFGIEWMRFEPGSPVNTLIKEVPHIAFEVDDLDSELIQHDLKIITPPNSPGKGIRVAMIIHNGAPVELIEFEKT
ncbi:VOC family protein [Bacteroidota bacterium]